MVNVNWDAFGQLPGAATYNFEMLCRHLMHRHYAAHGDFKATANQAGIEFHLRLDGACALGDAGRWFGWQCRWYDLPSGRAIGVNRRKKIKKAIEDTVRDLSGLTDWLLWTRHPLTKGDQDWFYGLKSVAGDMRLTLWTSANVEEHLAGPGELYRETYFGELVLTPDGLRDLHERAVAPVRFRWLPEAHQPVNAERALQQMLGDLGAREQLTMLGTMLEASRAEIAHGLADQAPGGLRDVAEEFVAFLGAVRDHALAIAADLERGDWQTLRSHFDDIPRLLPQHRVLVRQLRNAQSPLALPVTNALDDLRGALVLMATLDEHLSVRMVAVVAGAGNGKTHLAAQITAHGADRPAGIFLQGRQLAARNNLDDVARTISIGGRPSPSMEALLAALDAAGERAHRRLPLVIDGLNEAEDPREWRNLLSAVEPLLSRYPHVLLVVTLRKRFVDECLPTGARQLLIEGFDTDRAAAIDRYFTHYRIDGTDADLPEKLLDTPLALRLFCEVTNPDRARVVGLEAMPGSLTAVFDRYLGQVADHIAELAPVHFRIYPWEVRAALEKIGHLLWERRAYGIEFGRLRQLIDGDSRWDCSLVGMLEQEGILLRTPIRDRPGMFGMIISFDALAGHVIADALIAARGRDGMAQWLAETSATDALTLGHDHAHPLAEDIFAALAGLLPRQREQQLWGLVEGTLRNQALMLTTALEPRYLDRPTVEALGTLVRDADADHNQLFKALQLLRGARAHPLNADFLDHVLGTMDVADRDTIWTEWARPRWRDLTRDLRELEQRWTAGPPTDRRDVLRARWAMWLLTSTVRDLRDQATRALYWFGRRSPADLFDLALESLEINDRYVSERTMAAAYGVVMAHQQGGENFGAALPPFLSGLREALLGPEATRPTDDWLVRLYVRGIFYFARAYCPGAVPEGLPTTEELVFRDTAAIEPIATGDPHDEEVSSTLHMDFENYTVGRLIEGCANYDRRHPQYQQILSTIKGTIWALGWREEAFEKIDGAIAAETYPRAERSGNAERYGKKYSWIGFYTAAGRLESSGERHPGQERLSDLGIDPSFPGHLPPLPRAVPDWAQPTPAQVEDWVVNGAVSISLDLLEPSQVDGHPGPWVAVGGHLETNMQAPGRRVWGMLNVVLADKGDAVKVAAAFAGRDYPGRYWIPEPPQDYYTFAGEIPWHPTFANDAYDKGQDGPYRRTLDLGDGDSVEVELLAHRFTWEGYEATSTDIGTVLVPSKELSSAGSLRADPQAFHQFDRSGAAASLSYGPPPRMTGHLLYIRRDVLRNYAQGRDLVLLWWGERQPRPYPSDRPQWLTDAWQAHNQVWRVVRHIDLDDASKSR